ncbi:NADP-dependent oxidoreductase domain-containing protein [Leucosporidium creatinivorum]|uniref:NADP-dependent oxidoreductase domain-containing protein n=1 Tax=Leucosporidium creatinivorum TaxID=106004 RepID=A0A1Y2EKZ8_9BASI|nr:NADP-dependent oxidoreductase domain-containing protein [Leucosporidium creatinivorum]
MTLRTKIGYTRMGQSGLKVSKIILGCMSYGNTKWNGGWCLDYEHALPHFKKAWELGINTWDTANVYSDGDSERLVGRAVRELQIPREELVLLTKVYYPVAKEATPVGNVNQQGLSRKHIFQSVRASLERLQMDYIDVLQCHRSDPETPIEETMDALHDLVKMGLVRYIGMSTCRTAEFMQMQYYAKSKNQTMFISMQPPHSAVYREEERDMFLACKLTGAGIIPWSPLARGFLTRSLAEQKTTARSEKDPYLAFMTKDCREACEAVNVAIQKVAEKRGYSMAQVALAWSLSNPLVTAPIVGTTRVESLEELVQASHIVLTSEEIDSISSPYVPRPSIFQASNNLDDSVFEVQNVVPKVEASLPKRTSLSLLPAPDSSLFISHISTTIMSSELPTTVGYTRLGNSGLKVSKVILGTMTYGNSGWASWVLEEEESIPHFKAAWEAGINTWDTANVYSNGDSERIVGKAIKAIGMPRDEVVILTKVHMVVQKDPKAHPSALKDPNSRDYVNAKGLSRKHIFDSVKASLARMDIEYIDLLQCHRFDPETPIEETMDALHDLVKMGLVRYIGMSSCYAYQFHAMQAYAASKNQTKFVSMQDFYNPVYREEEREMFPTCKLFGVGIIPWSPLARGYLTRPWKSQESNTTRAQTDPNYGKFVGLGNPKEESFLQAINEAIEKVAVARGYSMAQVALAWVMSNPNVTAPIIGSTKLDSIKELVQATHIKLTDEELQSISSPYQPRQILGHA